MDRTIAQIISNVEELIERVEMFNEEERATQRAKSKQRELIEESFELFKREVLTVSELEEFMKGINRNQYYSIGMKVAQLQGMVNIGKIK